MVKATTSGAGPHGGVPAEVEAGSARRSSTRLTTLSCLRSLVDNEFQAIWRQVTSDLEQSKRSFEDEGTTEDKAKAEYRDIAARRVRLGLILSEVGSRNKIEVSDDEVNRALLERVRQFPGQERKVYDFYRNNPQALAEIRAPLFEDKVIDFITELANVTEKPVSVEELDADPDGGRRSS